MPDPRIFPVESENKGFMVAMALSTLVLAANPNRVGLDLTNISAPAEAIYLGFGQAAVNATGKALTTYGSTYHMGTENLFLGAIYAVSVGGVAFLTYSEEAKP